MSSRRRQERPPDIEVGARVSAKKLRFRTKPETEGQFRGGTRIRTDEGIREFKLVSDSESERHNLPDEVEPGVVYRTVEIGWAAEARAELPEDVEENEDER